MEWQRTKTAPLGRGSDESALDGAMHDGQKHAGALRTFRASATAFVRCFLNGPIANRIFETATNWIRARNRESRRLAKIRFQSCPSNREKEHHLSQWNE
jgi:hypothetical protein